MLKKSIITLTLLLSLAVVPAIARAQDVPPGKWWHMPRVSKHLELTEEEKGRLDEAFVESRLKLITLKSNIEREQFELNHLLDGEALDEAALTAQFEELEQARAELAAERFHFLLEVRKIVGFERFRRLKTPYELRQRKKHHGPRRGGDRFGPGDLGPVD